MNRVRACIFFPILFSDALRGIDSHNLRRYLATIAGQYAKDDFVTDEKAPKAKKRRRANFKT